MGTGLTKLYLTKSTEELSFCIHKLILAVGLSLFTGNCLAISLPLNIVFLIWQVVFTQSYNYFISLKPQDVINSVIVLNLTSQLEHIKLLKQITTTILCSFWKSYIIGQLLVDFNCRYVAYYFAENINLVNNTDQRLLDILLNVNTK